MATIGPVNQSGIVVQTRLGQCIKNGPISGHYDDADLNSSERIKSEFPEAVIRTGPTRVYNCHGMTFASRRTAIYEPGEVDKILADDSYKDVLLNDVKPGDVVLYCREEEAIHSGIVTHVERGFPPRVWVCSKWGHLNEVVHPVEKSRYSEGVKYKRVIHGDFDESLAQSRRIIR